MFVKFICCTVFAAVFILVALSTPSPAQAASALGPDADWQRTLEAAKKEGKVSVFLARKDPMNTFRDTAKNIRLELPTESREKFLTGRLGARLRYSQRFKPLVDRRSSTINARPGREARVDG